ncbi:MAG: ABC transporter substrate-binding protein [Deltaproteobacteria bacterium]|nr:ABC transporter substrate-binding protein [Deltaproteobacteria bacterium]
MKIKIPLSQLTLVVLLSAIFTSPALAKDLNYGWPGPGSWTTLPFVVANERGFFEKEGLKVRMISFRGTNIMLAALLAGEIDFGTYLPFFVGAAANGLPVKIVGSVAKSGGYALIGRPGLQNVAALKGKKIGINSFGSSADFAAYMSVRGAGMDPNKDVTIVPMGGGTPDRLAALASGAVDATVITSPGEFAAEKQGFKILVPMKELAKLARIPLTGVAVTHKKIDKESDEIVRVLRALRGATSLLQDQPEFGIATFEKGMRLDRATAKEYYGLFRDQYNPDMSLPDSVIEELLAVETFRAKEKDGIKTNITLLRDWSFAEKARR